MDTQTRHALKKDSFAQAAATSVSWISGHRSGVLRWVISAVAVLLLIISALMYWNMRSSEADVALGAAMDAYSAQLAQPGAPVETGTYASASDRTKAANQLFVEVAAKYGWLSQGAKAHYFVGVTDQEMGQSTKAETELKIAGGAWDRNLANLAKRALASLYHISNRDDEAIQLYNSLAAKPSETVPTVVAQLDLADLYASAGKQDQARALWAKIKDADKDGVAGSIASEKLGGK